MAGVGCTGWGQRPNSPKTGTERCQPVPLSSPTVTQIRLRPRLPGRGFSVKSAIAQADSIRPGRAGQQLRATARPAGSRAPAALPTPAKRRLTSPDERPSAKGAGRGQGASRGGRGAAIGSGRPVRAGACHWVEVISAEHAGRRSGKEWNHKRADGASPLSLRPPAPDQECGEPEHDQGPGHDGRGSAQASGAGTSGSARLR